MMCVRAKETYVCHRLHTDCMLVCVYDMAKGIDVCHGKWD